MIAHNIPPVFNEKSEILILGSFPSVKSREAAFFYGHLQNRFWRMLSVIYNVEPLTNTEEKKAFLLDHKIALWDVIASCDIDGSSDATIRNVQTNDIALILKRAPICKIIVNGKTAEKYYNKYLLSVIGRTAICLPSTSPANAAVPFDRLVEIWGAHVK